MIDQFQSHGFLVVKGIEYSVQDNALVWRKEIHEDPAWTEVDWAKAEFIEDDPLCEYSQLQVIFEMLSEV